VEESESDSESEVDTAKSNMNKQKALAKMIRKRTEDEPPKKETKPTAAKKPANVSRCSSHSLC